MAINYDPSDNDAPQEGINYDPSAVESESIIPFTNGENLGGLVNKISEGGSYTNESVGEYATALSLVNLAEGFKNDALASAIAAANSATNASNSANQASLSANESALSSSEASASAAGSASSATSSANSASEALVSQLASEDARDASIVAQGLSEDARDAAVIAQGLSEDARDASIVAQGLSEAAQSASESARDASITARNASEAAQLAAETAEDGAQTAEAGAIAAQTAAETAQSLSETAQGLSETAQAASELARDESVIAQLASEAAQAASEAAKLATESLFDQFGDQYLGSKASDPTVDNDGDPLTEGDIYWNSTANVLKFYDGASWVAPETLAENSATAAQAAQAAAELAETNAATSASNAATSETNAAASESAASNSAGVAALNASSAANSASSSATSASNAATSESNAATSETNAANSATASATSASESASSASAAASSATDSATSASESATSASESAASAANALLSEQSATSSASSATTSAANALVSETNAASSESNAATSESNASSSASQAAVSASNSATSAANAATSESNAATSETNAAASESAAQALIDEINGIYLGVQLSDPSVDLNGDPLNGGEWYYNSDTNITRIYVSGTGWVNGAVDTSSFVLKDSVATLDSLQLNGGTGTQGTLTWNADEETIDAILNGSTLQLGQELHYHVRNNTASLIPNGTVVMATGTLGASGRITVAPFVADGNTPVKYMIGVTTEDIGVGEDGKVSSFGKVRHVDTSTFNDGDVLYVSNSVAGGFTNVAPTGSSVKLAIAIVIHAASNGTLFVRVHPEDENAFATYAQGLLADSAIQPGDNVSTLTNDASYATTSYVDTAESDAVSTANAYTDTRETAITSAYQAYANQAEADAVITANAYTDQEVAALVSAAPGTLDTLNELAAALGDDPNFATTVTDSIATKLDATANAVSASKLQTARTISLSGDVSGSVSFDGTSNVSITAVVADDSHNHTIANVDGLQTALDGKVDDSQVLTNVPAGAVFTDTVYTHPSYAGDDFSVDTGALTGATVVSDIDINVTTDSLGHVTDANGVVSTRTLTLADLGYTGATNANNYVHPSHPGDDFSVDTGPLTGATVVSDIDINVTTDGLGHVTDANGVVSTRTLTLGDLGYTGATNANYFTYTHPATHPATMITTTDEFAYSNSSNVQDVLDDLDQAIANVNAKDPVLTLAGDVTGSATFTNLGNATLTATVANDSHTHDGRYYTESEADSRFVNITGDTMTGNLTLDSGTNTTLTVLSDDTGKSEIALYGSSQGTGRVYVGQSSAYGGGIEYNGDGSPTTTGAGSDYITLYRNNNGDNQWTARNLYSDNNWIFRGNLYANTSQRVFADDYHPNADKWTTARTLSLTGDVTGSVSWDGSGNASITATVANDSHSHSTYLPLSGGTLTGDLSFGSQTGTWISSTAMSDSIGWNTNYGVYIGSNTLGYNSYVRGNGTFTNNTGTHSLFHDGYHPNADKWTTARTLSLTGAVTGSASIDGSGNVSLATTATSDPTLTLSGDASGSATFTNLGNATLNVTVADDSHNHIIANVDGLQTALDGKQANASDLLKYRGTISNNDWNTYVDGTEAGFYGVVNATGANRPNAYQYGLALSASVANQAKFQLYAPHNGSQNGTGLFFRSGWGTDYDPWAEIWHSNNDGSGSGLDADLLDGVQGSSFLRSDATDSFTTLSGTSLTATTLTGTDIYLDDQILSTGDTDTYIQFHAADQWRVVTGGGERLEVNNTNVTISNTLVETSDRRLKSDIEVIDNALDKVQELSGYTYYKEGVERKLTGVIAQEVQSVLPEAVQEDEEGTLSVSYGNMVGLLIEAIKEQQKQIDELKAQIK